MVETGVTTVGGDAFEIAQEAPKAEAEVDRNELERQMQRCVKRSDAE